jgi:hypothetical protein
MQENKSIVEEALIQMKNVEEAIAQNAKGILASTMKEEISQLVKESLSEQEEDEVELDLDAEMDMDSDEEDMDMDVDNEDEDEIEMDLDASDDFDSEEPIDLTGASDDEILKIFKAMGEEDGIIVKKDGEDIHITDNNQDAEYLVKLGESEEMEESMDDELDEEDMELDMDSDMSSDMDSDMGSESDIDMIVNKLFDGDSHLEEDMDDMDDMDDEDMDDEEMDEIVYEIEMDDEMAEDDDIDPMGGMSIDVDSEMSEQSMDPELDIEMESEMYEEDEMEESYDHKRVGVKEAKMAMKPKGIGMGKPDFKYDGETEYKSPKKMKQGTKGVGMGKPKFEYKKGENMEGKAKKVETKEGQGYKDKEDEKLSMKHGKIASKKLDSTKSRRDDAKFEKEETKEAARTYGFGSKEGRGLRKGITNNRNYVYGNNGVKTESIENEVKQLREKNEEYRKALNIFRSKLNEVAIFNSNLAYATRLFTEHSTTKKEKINILRRFDGVESLKESKNLYRTLKDELGHVETPSKSINESVGKIDKVVTTGSSATLMENKTYEAPQFLRIKDLMGKIG